MTDAELVKAKVNQMLAEEERIFNLLMKAHELVMGMIADSQFLGSDVAVFENALQMVSDNLVSCDVQLDMVREQLEQLRNRL